MDRRSEPGSALVQLGLRTQMRKGFTLAELLIALAILGVIAVFTIPKVLLAQQDAKSTAIGKEVAGMISGAYAAYRLNNTTVTSGVTVADLLPYMNYVAIDTATEIDRLHEGTTLTCGASTDRCIRLHNGAILRYTEGQSFAGTATTNAIPFTLDPDGRVTDGTTNGPGKSVNIYLYYNGKLRTMGTAEPGTVNSVGTVNPVPAWDPPWFSWD